MKYTISQVARKTGLSMHTLRYYDRVGLLPFVERGPSGFREFQQSDLEWLDLINCLKGTGMPIRDIGRFLQLCRQGDETMEQRLQIIRDHKKAVEAQQLQLEKYLAKINHKVAYYETACQQAREQAHTQQDEAQQEEAK